MMSRTLRLLLTMSVLASLVPVASAVPAYAGAPRPTASDGPDEFWTRQFGSSDADEAWGVAVDGSGNAYVAGTTAGALPGQTDSGGAYDAFVRKYGPDGAVLWTRQFGTTASDEGLGIAVDDLGNAWVSGRTRCALAGAPKGGRDAFLRRYAPDGSVLWTRQFGTVADDEPYFVAVDGLGGIWLHGETEGGLAGANKGKSDVFLRKYHEAP